MTSIDPREQVHVPATPRPEGFHVDFFGIGAPRCRSTWLATCLDEHPQIAISRPKEPEFFVARSDVYRPYRNPRFARDWQAYASSFAHAEAGRRLGDFSINLFHNQPEAPEAIADAFPDARFILALRDPVARTYSHYWFHYGMARHWGWIPDTFAEAIDHGGVVDRSRYWTNLQGWLQHFDRDRFHFVLDLDLRRDPETCVRDVFSFLGVDPAFSPPSLHYRVNAGRRRRGVYGTMYRLATRLRKAGWGPLVDGTKRLGIEHVLNRLDITRKPAPPIEPQDAARLRRMLLPEIEGLEDFLGRDLSPWKKGVDESGPGPPMRDGELVEQLRPNYRANA